MGNPAKTGKQTRSWRRSRPTDFGGRRVALPEGPQDKQSREEEEPTDTPFARFEDLVRKLVSVPKEELDALRDED